MPTPEKTRKRGRATSAMPIEAEGTSSSHNAVRIKWTIQVTTPPIRSIAPPTHTHCNFLTSRSKSESGSFITFPLSQLRSFLRFIREIAHEPLLHLFNSDFPTLTDLPDRDDGKEFCEEQIEEGKEAEASRCFPPLNPSRSEEHTSELQS